MAYEGEAQPSRTWDPIADSLKTAIDSLLGKNYRNRRGKKTLHPLWRWLSATFGASLSLIAVYIRSTVAFLSIEPSQLAADMFGRLANILPWILWSP